MKVSATLIIPGGVAEPMTALDRIKIIENHEPLVDLRERCPKVIFPDDAGTPDGMVPFLRESAAMMLDRASRQLPNGLQLFALSAYRSFERQKGLWQQHYDLHKKIHPNWPESQLRRATNQYAAPCDHIAPPGHCTGAAIDIVLRAVDSQFVDILPDCGKDTAGIHRQGRVFENLSLSEVTQWKLGATWATHLPPELKKYRMILIETMYGVGFSNCRDEYWHYSYGDSGWAVRVGAKECPYGVADLSR